MPGLCDDLRVIDLSSGPAGGIATMVLADFGADVVKIERPGGDPLRRLTAWPVWLRGKRSVTLDLRAAEAQRELRRLTDGADVVVASFRPGSAERLSADYATLAASNPGLVYCSITAFGPQGPLARYPGYEGVVAAKAGRMQHFAGLARRDGPQFAAVQVATHAASQSALTGVLAALLVRERTGRGQLVETSLLQGLYPFDTNSVVRSQFRRRYPEAMASDISAQYGVQPPLYYQPVLAKDGQWLQLANLIEHLFHSYLLAIGLGEIYDDERFLGAPRRLDEGPREELRTRMLERMRERTAAEWLDVFRKDGNVAADVFGSTQLALTQPDMVAAEEVVKRTHPRLGPVRQVGLLATLDRTPGIVGGPAPDAGAHTAEVLAEPPRAPRALSAEPAATPARGPLDGATVLEFATIIAAPLGTSLLADLGARVIKVEPLGGDPVRGLGAGLGAYMLPSKTTAGKESICVDLKTSEGRALVERLLALADVVVHNYRPGVPERLGIGYEQARALRPDVVYVHANGYHARSASAARPSAHPIPGAVVGGALQQAGPAVLRPAYEHLDEIREGARWLFRANEANPDPSTSMVVASATLLGLYARKRTGEGQQIFLSMLGANAYANSDDFVSYEGKAPRRPLDAELHGLSALYRLYRAREGWVFLAAPTDREWQGLARALSGQLAADPRFATAEARDANDAELASALAACLAERTADEWEQLLIPLDVGCVRADIDPGEFLGGDEQVLANGFAPEAEHTMWGRYRRWAPLVTFADTPARLGPGALAGEHTDAILGELGYDAAAVAELRASKVVASEPVMDPATVR